MAVDEGDVIDHVVVKVGVNTTGLRETAQAEIDKAMAGVKAKVKLVADKTGFAAHAREELAKVKVRLTYPVHLKPVTTGFTTLARAELKALAAKSAPLTYKVKLVPDTKGTAATADAKAAIRRLADDAVNADRDTEHQRTDIARQGGRVRGALLRDEERLHGDHLNRIESAERRSNSRRAASAQDLSRALLGPKLINFGGEGARPLTLLYASVVALAPALVAMASSAVQASTAVTALGAAGIGAGLALGGLMLAFTPVASALKLAQTTQVQGLVKGAKNATTGAIDMAKAQRSVADAQKAEAQAYAGVHKARQEAIRDLEDLRKAVMDLDNQYKSDRLSVAEAARDEKATNANFFATALDRARAHQNTLDARTRLADTQLERKQKRQDLAKSLQQGIEGSDKVRSAKEAASAAHDRTLNAKAGATKKSIQATDLMSAAQENLNFQLAHMAPAAREMFYWFQKNQELLNGFRKTIEQGVLPGFNKFLHEVTEAPKGKKSTLQIASEYAAQLGGIIGKYAGRFGKITNMVFFRKDMATIQKNNATSLEILGKAAERLIRPVLKTLAASSPLLISFSKELLKLATRFDQFIENAANNGSLQQWFKDAAHQASLWYDILKDVGGFLKDIFTASLPAGGGLVTALRDTLDSLTKWSSSTRGQAQIKGFFDRIASLPFGDIRDMVIRFGELFATMATVRFAAASPFFAAIGTLAASNPATAVRFLDAITAVTETIAKVVVANPKTTAFILGLVALGKVSKAGGGILLKLPGIETLTNTLRSKFSGLDRLLTTFNKASVMNVQAAVVNINGPGGVPGAPGAPILGGGAAERPGRLAPGTGGNLALSAGLAVGAAIVGQINTDGSPFQKGVQDAVSGSLNGAALGTLIGGPLGTAIGAAIGAAAGLTIGKYEERQRDMQTAVGREKHAFNTALNAGPAIGPDGKIDYFTLGQAVTTKPIQDYIKARKESVAAAVENERALHGEAAARRLQIAETRRSADSLTTLLAGYTENKEGAKKYANAAFDLNGLLERQQQDAYLASGQMDAAAAAIRNAGGAAKDATPHIKVLGETVDSLTGEKVITFTTDGKDKVQSDLEGLAAYQELLRQNKPFTPTNIRTQRAIFHKADPEAFDPKTGAKRKAFGGQVGGHAADSRVDNVPAWLTPEEYVQPVSAVKYYGVGFMDAVRSKRFPKFAAGGPVNQWPFVIKVPPEAAEITYGPAGPIVPYTGRIPKGLGAVKGVNAKMMAVAIDAKKAFPGEAVVSGFRKNAITVTGKRSYHGFGRALDFAPPSMQLFQYLKNKYDGAIRELIFSPAGRSQVWNGKDHLYTGAVRATHWNHVHLALAKGGLVPARRYDTGGKLPPGYSLAYNGTGQAETVRTKGQEQALQGPVRLDRRDLVMLAASINSGSPSAITMDGRRVAELTNRYNYLPSGVR